MDRMPTVNEDTHRQVHFVGRNQCTPMKTLMHMIKGRNLHNECSSLMKFYFTTFILSSLNL